MLTKNNIKFIKSLQLKKFRQKERLFIVEGEKNTVELLASDFEIQSLVISTIFSEKYPDLIQNKSCPVVITDAKTISQLGTYNSNEMSVAIVKEPNSKIFSNNGIQLVLDDIRDPGNLGTIIRIADWYGIQNVICSTTSAEFFNPKVISASMGSIFRINLFREDLHLFLSENPEVEVYGAFMEGENVHKTQFKEKAFILIGNESHGINSTLLDHVSHKINIPRIGQAESLNAAMATAIICDNIFRNT